MRDGVRWGGGVSRGEVVWVWVWGGGTLGGGRHPDCCVLCVCRPPTWYSSLPFLSLTGRALYMLRRRTCCGHTSGREGRGQGSVAAQRSGGGRRVATMANRERGRRRRRPHSGLTVAASRCPSLALLGRLASLEFFGLPVESPARPPPLPLRLPPRPPGDLLAFVMVVPPSVLGKWCPYSYSGE